MTDEEIQKFYEEHQYYPTRPDSRPPRVFTPARSSNASGTQRGFRHLAPRGWRAPLHWDAPPAFGNPGRVYELLGHEAYCEAVKDYWESFGNLGVEKARLVFDKWVIKRILKTFEAHVRGFRRQDASSRRNTGHGGGGLFTVASSEIVLPETLIAEGRLVKDLRAWLVAYGVNDIPATEQRVKVQLEQIWGVKVA